MSEHKTYRDMYDEYRKLGGTADALLMPLLVRVSNGVLEDMTGLMQFMAAMESDLSIERARDEVVPVGPYRGCHLGVLTPAQLLEILDQHMYRKWTGLIQAARLLWTHRSHGKKKADS